MTIEKIVEYVLHTPFNTNRAILASMLEQLILDHNGSLTPGGSGGTDEPGGSGGSGKDVIYDGGVES